MSATPTEPKPEPAFAVHREEWLTDTIAELTNSQRKRKDASDSALRQTQRATVLILDAEGLLKSGGNACARIRLQQARERIDAAMSYLPET